MENEQTVTNFIENLLKLGICIEEKKEDKKETTTRDSEYFLYEYGNKENAKNTMNELFKECLTKDNDKINKMLDAMKEINNLTDNIFSYEFKYHIKYLLKFNQEITLDYYNEILKKKNNKISNSKKVFKCLYIYLKWLYNSYNNIIGKENYKKNITLHQNILLKIKLDNEKINNKILNEKIIFINKLLDDKNITIKYLKNKIYNMQNELNNLNNKKIFYNEIIINFENKIKLIEENYENKIKILNDEKEFKIKELEEEILKLQNEITIATETKEDMIKIEKTIINNKIDYKTVEDWL